jgi:hypothetical protein
VGEAVDAEAGIHRFHPQDREIQRGEHEVTTICACTNKINDKWDIQYNPQSTQFMGKNVCAMNSILTCLDTRIRSGNS